jgi:hypothetical protein
MGFNPSIYPWKVFPCSLPGIQRAILLARVADN